MGGAPRHCSLRPRTHHGPWSPPIHHGCPRPRIFYGHLENSLPLSLRLYVLSLSLVSRFPLGPSLCRGSLLRPGGRLSRLLRPGGRLSRLLRPGGRLSRLLRPGGRPTCQSHLTPPLICQSHLTPPLIYQSHLTPPLICQSHLTPPLICQSHLTPPLICQSHLTPPLICQSHLTSLLTCQSLVTPQQFTQCHFTSLLSLPHRPGGLLSHWLLMDLALHSLFRFHLRSTTLLDDAVYVKRVEAAPWGGVLSRIWSPLTTLQLHITHGLHIPSCTALTHSRPPLHQSHSCHHSLISLDCFTTPVPHSHTHI